MNIQKHLFNNFREILKAEGHAKDNFPTFQF